MTGYSPELRAVVVWSLLTGIVTIAAMWIAAP